MLDINITLLIQLGNFIITLFVLDFLLIKPIRGIIRKRRDLAGSMLADAESFSANAASKLENYEAALAKAREDAAALREAAKNDATAREAAILERARQDAQEYLHLSREETQNAVATASADLEKRLPALSQLAVTRLLGTSKQSPAV